MKRLVRKLLGENFLCRIGVHRPLDKSHVAFIDLVSGKRVYYAKCPCGKKWMTDGNPWTGYRITVKDAIAEVEANKAEAGRTVKDG